MLICGFWQKCWIENVFCHPRYLALRVETTLLVTDKRKENRDVRQPGPLIHYSIYSGGRLRQIHNKETRTARNKKNGKRIKLSYDTYVTA